jgi:hypothetical protein
MKYIITESNLKNLLSKSFLEHGFVETMERMRLTLPQIFKIYGDHKLPKLSCTDLYEICDSVVNSGSESMEWWGGSEKVMKLNHKRGDYVVEVYPGGYGETVYFKVTKISTGDVLDGVATPYWDGNCFLPVDVDLYIKKGVITGRPLDEYVRFELKQDFETFKDIITWLNVTYVSNILHMCRPIFKQMEYENQFL